MTFLLYAFFWLCTYIAIMAVNVVAGVLERKKEEINGVWESIFVVNEYRDFNDKLMSRSVTIENALLCKVLVAHVVMLVLSSWVAIFHGLLPGFIIYVGGIFLLGTSILLIYLTKWLYKTLVNLLEKLV